jgi:nucleotide-binding universal stress UspA family protein
MYKKILAAVNEFTNSETAARYAIALAKACPAHLSLVFVSEEGASNEALRRAESALKRLFLEAESEGVDVESIVEKGDPLNKITGRVNGQGIDIVFAATRREDVAKRFFIKSHARELMLKLPCPVVLTRVVRMGRVAPRRILFPVRGGAAGLAERAYFVTKLAETFGSHVTLFHMPEPARLFSGKGPVPGHAGPALPKEIERVVEYLAQYGISHEKKTAKGSVAWSITAEAAARRTDLIVMGASQRSLLKSFVKGNPVEDVLRSTPCNLMIFRP